MLKRALAISLEEEDKEKEFFSIKGERLIKTQKWHPLHQNQLSKYPIYVHILSIKGR